MYCSLFLLSTGISHTTVDGYFSFAGKSKEAEVKRINKELANIRSKFKGMQHPRDILVTVTKTKTKMIVITKISVMYC